MTKSEIVKEISARTGIDGKAVLAVVEGFINEVKTSLGKEVIIIFVQICFDEMDHSNVFMQNRLE